MTKKNKELKTLKGIEEVLDEKISECNMIKLELQDKVDDLVEIRDYINQKLKEEKEE